MPQVTLKTNSEDISIEIANNKSLLEQLQERDIYIRSSCGGFANCSECIVKIVAGEENINKITPGEIKCLGNVFHITKERLSCQLYCSEQATFDISHHNRNIDIERLKQKGNIFVKKSSDIVKPEKPPEGPRDGGKTLPRRSRKR